MSIFDDAEIVSTYTLEQAIEDGIVVQLLRGEDRPVMATAHIYNNFKDNREELVDVFHKFKIWKAKIEPTLPEEEKLFCTFKNDKKVWVIEDSVAYTIMYPEDY